MKCRVAQSERDSRWDRSSLARARSYVCSTRRNRLRALYARKEARIKTGHSPRLQLAPGAARLFQPGTRREHVARLDRTRSFPASDTRARSHRSSQRHHDERNNGREQNEIGERGPLVGAHKEAAVWQPARAIEKSRFRHAWRCI